MYKRWLIFQCSNGGRNHMATKKKATKKKAAKKKTTKKKSKK
jgi:hypothetical protein